MRMLRGVCSGEGRTFLPLVQQLHEAADITDADARDDALRKLNVLLEGAPDAPEVVRRISDPLGLSDDTVTLPEIFWAARRAYETLAGVGSAVVSFAGFDDAPVTLEDMLGFVERTTDAPIRVERIAGPGDRTPVHDPAEEGRRAHERGDLPSAAYLLSRAVNAAPDDAGLRLDFAEVLLDLGDGSGAEQQRRAGEALEPDRFEVLRLRLAPHDVSEDDITRALERAGDERERARGYELLAELRWTKGDYTRAGEALQRAFEHARRAGLRRTVARLGAWLLTWLYHGPTPVEVALTACEDMAPLARADPLLEARRLAVEGGLHGLQGDFDTARALLGEATELQRRFGQPLALGGAPQIWGDIELCAGDAPAAERAFALAHEGIEAAGDPDLLLATRVATARALIAQGRLEAAEAIVAGIDEDHAGQVQALVLEAKGDTDEALRRATRGLEALHPAHEPKARADALRDLAHVLDAGGRAAEAEAARREAAELYARKGISITLP